MEGNNVLPRIIEFNGLPGTGKTTISYSLENLFLVDAPIFYEYYRRKYHKNRYSLLLSPMYWAVIWKLVRFSNTFKEPRPLDFSLSTVKYIRMYRHFIKDNPSGVLIIDQGVLQGLVSIAHADLIENDDIIISFLKECKFGDYPILIINCECDIQSNELRLAQRSNRGSRVQKLPVGEMRHILKIQADNFRKIRHIVFSCCPNIPFLNLNTELLPSCNSEIITSYFRNLRTL